MALENFLLNTNAPIDKIVWMHEGEWTATNDELMKSFDIPTGIDSIVFPMGEWTMDNWATSYPLGIDVGIGEWDEQMGSFTEKRVGTGFLLGGIIGGVHEVYLTAYSAKTGVQIKFRAYGVIKESDWDAETSATAVISNPLSLDTRDNYPKLFAEGEADATNANVEVFHNLGFRPMIRVWTQLPSSEGDVLFYPNSADIAIDSQKITLPQGFKYYYRIYADEI